MSSSGSTIKGQVIDVIRVRKHHHLGVLTGIMMPKSNRPEVFPDTQGNSSTSHGYHTKVPNQARRPKNLKIGQMHENDEIPKGSRIARKSSRMSRHASHEVLQLKSSIQDQKPKTKILFVHRPKVPEIPRLLCSELTWVLKCNKAPLQSPKSTNKGIKKNVRLKKSPTTQNFNNSQASTKEHYRWVPWFILN